MSRRKGKYLAANARRGLPLSAIVLIFVAVLCLGIGSVAAYLSTHTGAVENKFRNDIPTDPAIIEDFDGNTKSNVKVRVGEALTPEDPRYPGYSCYVRAAVVITWKDNSGNVLGTAPVASTAGNPGDYFIDYNTNDWILYNDGFYYHKTAVNTGGETAVLIRNCYPESGQTPGGYQLSVEIIAQTVQALGSTDSGDVPAVKDAWGVILENGQIQPPPSAD